MLKVVLDEHPFELSNLNDDDWADIPLYRGDRLANRGLVTRLRIEDERPLHDYFIAGGKPIVSADLRDVFIGQKVHAEFLPVEIQCIAQAAPRHPYYFMNILDLVDCVDEEKSVIRRSDRFGFVKSVERLVLKEAAECASPLFRLKSLPVRICANERVERAVIGSGTTGINFKNVSEYRFA